MSAADRLREAAALMRSRAEAATPGPWHVCAESPVDADSCVVNDSHDPVAALMDEWYEADLAEPTAVHDAAHIAAAHPIFMLAVADWLDDIATRHAPSSEPVELFLHLDSECSVCDDGGHECTVCEGCYPTWEGMDGHSVYPCSEVRAALKVADAYLAGAS